jgi:hypothetical protein
MRPCAHELCFPVPTAGRQDSETQCRKCLMPVKTIAIPR